jgi:hypothetical protein
MTLFILYLLATLDGALCGFRSSMGRFPYIHKIRFYTMAMLRGVFGAQIASWLSLLVLLGVMSVSQDRSALRLDLQSAAERMLWIFLPYAALVLFNLALRLVPSTDLRSATSVVFLGPLTFLRPFVMIIGVLFGIWHAQLRATICLGLFVLLLMLSLEFALNLYNGKLQEKQIRSLI